MWPEWNNIFYAFRIAVILQIVVHFFQEVLAPYGYIVQVDFRDQFHLEESPNCDYDSLEVRNGPYGYSDLIGRYCGSDFPSIITSSGRHLWIKFSSDDSIEYTGFRAVYKFSPVESFNRPEKEVCLYRRGGSDGIITNEDIQDKMFNYSLTWNVPLDCTWIIKVSQGLKMYLSFKKYELTHPNNCELNYIDIYADTLSMDDRLDRFCGTATEPQRSEGNTLHVRYFADPKAFYAKFTIIYTAFRESEHCYPDSEFDCDDGTCIDKSLKCNGHFNCRYRYDEEDAICVEGSLPAVVLKSEHMIIILVVFFALVVGMCASISISCYGKIKERRERNREYRLRRSKEASVEVALDHIVNTLDRGLEATLAAQAAQIGARRKAAEVSQEDIESENIEMDQYCCKQQPNGGQTLSQHQKRMLSQPSLNVEEVITRTQEYTPFTQSRNIERAPCTPPHNQKYYSVSPSLNKEYTHFSKSQKQEYVPCAQPKNKENAPYIPPQNLKHASRSPSQNREHAVQSTRLNKEYKQYSQPWVHQHAQHSSIKDQENIPQLPSCTQIYSPCSQYQVQELMTPHFHEHVIHSLPQIQGYKPPSTCKLQKHSPQSIARYHEYSPHLKLQFHDEPQSQDLRHVIMKSSRDSESPPLPPPPPPPLPPHLRRNREIESQHYEVTGNQFKPCRTAVIPPNEEEIELLNNPHRFRAEAVIEMNPSEEDRPQSFESTRSAPDVIVHR
ncbi:uncharacterized protein LOC143237663 isoform X3 [Tachypleus tridentatus]|uniref:uncharacterized protein LOC143237663 isoform X3 n=1 Tax=Tachypleus tridentatus TaxID=6853 RepID=UPI003FD6843B